VEEYGERHHVVQHPIQTPKADELKIGEGTRSPLFFYSGFVAAVPVLSATSLIRLDVTSNTPAVTPKTSDPTPLITPPVPSTVASMVEHADKTNTLAIANIRIMVSYPVLPMVVSFPLNAGRTT